MLHMQMNPLRPVTLEISRFYFYNIRKTIRKHNAIYALQVGQ